MESYEMFTRDCSSDYLGLILSFYGKVKGLGSIRGFFGLNILGKLNTFVKLVLYLHNLNIITCF